MAVNVNAGALEFDAVINASQFNAAISSIERELTGLTQTAEKEASAIDNLVKKSVGAIAAYATLAAGSNFIADIVRVRGEFQQLEVAFETMLGSKAKADKLLADITEFAATTPFELSDVAAATKQLLAFGISSDKVKETLRSLGDVSAGIGAPLGEIAYLFGTIKTQGVALTQDIRQFAQRGIPIYEELAKILGVTVEQVGEFITAGKVGFPEVEKVFQNLTAEGSKFGGLMEAQSKTLLGQISNLRDAFAQMLNEIGRSGEGIFADAISGVKFLVDNYKTIIDILEVLVITYGSYRAAVIATNVINTIAAARENGLTVALFLRAKGLQIAAAAQRLLNLAMAANPAALFAAALVGLVSALTIFGRKVTEVRSKADLLAEAQKKVSSSMANQQAQLRPYIEALNAGNLSEERRIDIYNKLKAIDPSIVAGLDAKKLSQEGLTTAVDNYITSLRKKIKLEANQAAADESVKEENKIEEKLDALVKKRTANIVRLQKAFDQAKASNNGWADDFKKQLAEATNLVSDEITDTKNQLDSQRDVTKSLTEDVIKGADEEQKARRRTIDVIDEEIAAEKKKLGAESTTRAEAIVFQTKISQLEAEKKRIIGETKAETKAQNAEDNKALALLEKRKDLLEQIADRVKEAAVTNRSKEQTELDKINEKYDALIDNIDDYNKKVQAFNKINPNKKVQQIGQIEILELNKARSTELDNAALRAEADRFKKNLQEKQRLFEQYEEAKKQVGLQKANELFAEQTGNYKSFLELLQDEASRLAPKIQFGIANVGDIEKFKAITDEIAAVNKKKAEESIEEQKRQFIELLTATTTFNQQQTAINKKYDDLEATLKANSTVKEISERKKLLEQERKDRLAALQAENQSLVAKVTVGITDPGQLDQFRSIIDTVNKLQEDQGEEDMKRQQQNLASLLTAIGDFNNKRAALNKAFIEQQAAIEKSTTIKNKEAELKILKESREKQLAALDSEEQQLFATLSFGIVNEGEVERFKTIIASIKKLQQGQSEEDLKRQQKNFAKLISATTDFNIQKAAINKKYDDLQKATVETTTVTEVEERKKILQQARQDELDALNNELIRKSTLYKKLNQDIIGFTRQRLKDEIKLLQSQLKTDTSLTPQQQADIQGVIDQYKGLLENTNKTAKEFTRVAALLGGISSLFGDLAGALEGVNDNLADTLQTISDIASVGASAANAIAQFAAGNIVAGIAGTVQTLIGVFNIGKKAKESRIRSEEEIITFNQRVLSGELDITQEYRNRQREQAKLNKLKLEGLQAEMRLLEEQKKAILSQYEAILAQLNQETFVADLVKKKYGGVLGVGRKTKTVEIRETLNGLSFEEMEKLFSEGRLTGRAKDLFELLKKIKQEGADIDALLAENAEAAKQIFTGTTADSIVDSIAQGFESGKRSATDFAGTFEDLMRAAIISSLKFKYLEEPLKAFFEEFAKASESDNQLTTTEVTGLKNLFNSIITNANEQFNQLQDIAGININATTSANTNNLTGAIKGITEQQAELLAGQFGGLRITALEQLNTARTQLTTLNMIEVNTGTQVIRMTALLDRLQYWYEVKGIKIA